MDVCSSHCRSHLLMSEPGSITCCCRKHVSHYVECGSFIFPSEVYCLLGCQMPGGEQVPAAAPTNQLTINLTMGWKGRGGSITDAVMSCHFGAKTWKCHHSPHPLQCSRGFQLCLWSIYHRSCGIPRHGGGGCGIAFRFSPRN